MRAAARWSGTTTAIALVTASLAFATSGPLARMAAPASPFLMAAVRCSIAGFVAFAVARSRGALPLARLDRKAALGTLAAGVVLGAHFACYLWGVTETSLPAAITLVSLEPVSVVFAAWMFLGIRPSRGELAGVALATIGGAIVAGAGGSSDHRTFGDLLVLAAVVLYGGYVSLARRFASEVPPETYSLGVYSAAASSLVLVCLALRPPLDLPTSSWVCMGLLAAIPTLIGHTLVQLAARNTSPSLVSLVSPGETLGGLTLGTLLLASPPRGGELVGALVVLVGVIVAARAHSQPEAEA